MKKKIMSLCLIAVITVMAIAGASLAYLTDTDEADNVFTIGNVQIALHEQQRNEDGTALEAFKDDKILMPIVGSAQGEKDKFGLSTAANYVDKIITVKNTGESAAYVRVLMAVPVALDNVGDASQNVLHFNQGNRFMAEGNYVEGAVNADWKNWAAEELLEQNVEVEGVPSNIYCYTYTAKLEALTETGSACIVGFYLDKKVDNKVVDGKIVYTINGADINYDFSKGVTIPVYAQAVQADGFATAEDAFAAAEFPSNPWAE